MRPAGCPHDLELEQVLAGERIAAAEHAASCAHCAERLTAMRAAGEHFRTAVFPRLRDPVAAAASRPSWRLPWLLVPVAAAAAVLAVWLVPRVGPPPDHVGIKGSADPAGPTFEVYVGEGSTGRRLAPGSAVRPGDGLRFVASSPQRTVFVFTVDARGAVSRLYPADGEAPAVATGLLPGGAVLDEVTGPERVFAVFPDRSLRFSDVEAAVKRGLGEPGPEAVRRLERVPLDVPQRTVLLEKEPR